MASDFQKLKAEVEKGLTGKSEGIPFSLERVDNYISIRRAMYTLLGGNGGTGKTSLADSCYVLEPYEWYLQNKDKTHIRIEWNYRSMERPKLFKLAKWACYKIWKDSGLVLSPAELLGWRKDKISEELKHWFDKTEEFFTTMQDSKIINIIDGQENPRGIWKQWEQYALERGTEETVSEFEKVYHPNDENLITINMVDHAGKCRLETVDGSKTRKGTTDKLSEYASISRDRFGHSPVIISQFNRSIKSEIFNKQSDPEPTQESFKETGNLYDDCDMAISLFNPYKFKLPEHGGYDVAKFVDQQTGANYFRSLKILKSSYSEDDIKFGLGFMGQNGYWKTLPKAKEMDDSIYQAVKHLAYFINE